MDINDLTIGQAKELAALFGNNATIAPTATLNSMVGKKVIVRTYSAGCWFGTLDQKMGKEIILTNARRLWRWKAKDGIAMSGVAVHGIDPDNSKIETPTPEHWLEAIEIIIASDICISSIEGAKDVISR